MADQVDSYPWLQVEDENPPENHVKPGADLKKSRAVDDLISWSKMDEELRVAHNQKIENSQKPSMWEYNPKGGVPTEFANLEPSSFLISRQGRILCFLPKDVLTRICSMLSTSDFVLLSLTCRFLHWRMFTFCTCYSPASVSMGIEDRRGEDFWKRGNILMPTLIYFLNNENEEHDGLETEPMRLYSLEQEGQRGLFIQQPFCLRKPFFFDTLKFAFILPFYRKKHYDMCLPYIMAVRGLARNLNLSIGSVASYQYSFNFPKFLMNFSDTNDFFTTVNANSYNYLAAVVSPDENYLCKYFRYNRGIYINCPYARQMNMVDIGGQQNRLNVPIFQNSIGFYGNPLDSAIIATLKNFLTGSTNLVFHRYYEIEENNGRFPLFEYLFQEFGQFENFFYARTENYRDFHDCYHVWKKVIATENGEQLIIEMKKPTGYNSYPISMTIGKEEMFDEIINKHIREPFRENIRWKMETAVEPDDVEESKETQESDNVEELEESEEEQATSSIFCCQDYNCCTIQ